MNWWEWVFSGIGVLIVGLLLQRWLKSSSEHKSSLTAQGAKVTASPVASGTGITQTITETHHHYPQPTQEPQPEPARPNLRVVGADKILIHQGIDEVFYQSDQDQGYVALVVNVTNDARQNAANVGAIVKATVIYRDAGRQLLRVTGTWLGQLADAIQFHVDDSHSVIVGINYDWEFSVPSKRRVYHGIGHVAHLTDKNPLAVQRTTVTVRLTDADTGDFYCESQFEVELNPLHISPA